MYALVSWDFPSVAVASNGRIVVGAALISGGNLGYYTAYSDNGGSTWFGPYAVLRVRGGASRLVWSASGFHVFTINDSSSPLYTLEHYTSSDGVAWSQTTSIATNYPMPLKSAGISSLNGDLSFSNTPDAAASAGLGWVVAFPVSINNRNAINITTELGGGVTVNYTTGWLFT